MPNLVESRIQQIFEIFYLVNIVIGVDNMISVDDVFWLEHLRQVVNIFLNDVAGSTAAGRNMLVRIMLLERDIGMST